MSEIQNKVIEACIKIDAVFKELDFDPAMEYTTLLYMVRVQEELMEKDLKQGMMEKREEILERPFKKAEGD